MPFGFSVWKTNYTMLATIITVSDKASWPDGMRSVLETPDGWHVSTVEGSLAESAMVLLGAKLIAL